jgi:hypothetical protein
MYAMCIPIENAEEVAYVTGNSQWSKSRVGVPVLRFPRPSLHHTLIRLAEELAPLGYEDATGFHYGEAITVHWGP